MFNLHEKPCCNQPLMPYRPERPAIKPIVGLEAAMRETMTAKGTEKRSISIRRPTVLGKNSLFYQPQVLSIGPQHIGLPNLQNLQDVKWALLNSMFSDNSIRYGLSDFIECVKNLEEEARGCYQRCVELPSDDFVQILILDSIFIISMIFYNFINEPEKERLLEQPLLFSDLLLVENQIPFSIIHSLWDKTIVNLDPRQRYSLAPLLQKTPFWKKDLPSNNSSTPTSVDTSVSHLLDLYYKWNVSIPQRESKFQQPWLFHCCIGKTGTKIDAKKAIPSATELYEAGVKFKPKEKSLNMFDISFANGTLEIPTLVLESTKMSLLVNLLSHELATAVTDIVVGYVYFMDSLINTKKDITLLQKYGVINNKLGSNEEAAEFFNSLGDSCAPTKVNAANNFYTPVLTDMMNYTQSCWLNQKTSLMHNYFNNPWTGISVFAGGALLILAFVQTYFTVFPRK